MAGIAVSTTINGDHAEFLCHPDETLLEVLRERLGLMGVKEGCGTGDCSACSIILDDRLVCSCLVLGAEAEGRQIATVEGMAEGDKLHPMQSAFLKHDGFQCGFCTPGQICSAVALLDEAKNGEASYVMADVRGRPRAIQLSDEEIRERMSGNLCRCGAYPNIVTAIREAHTGKPIDQVAWRFVGEKKEDSNATL